MSLTVADPREVSSEKTDGRWKVVIYNNDTNTMQEVVAILIRATGCTRREAEVETWEAHTFGRADVHFAALAACQRAANIIGAIGIKTEVVKEWAED